MINTTALIREARSYAPSQIPTKLAIRLVGALERSNSKVFQLEAEVARLRGVIQRIRNKLHAHNRPDAPIQNEMRLEMRNLLDKTLSDLLPENALADVLRALQQAIIYDEAMEKFLSEKGYIEMVDSAELNQQNWKKALAPFTGRQP
jgi:hypothetical protein